MKKVVTIHTDGAARGNPGKSGVGAVIKITNYKLPAHFALQSMAGRQITNYKFKKFLGVATNNQAEYRALIFGLVEARKIIQKELLEDWEIVCYSDSELMVRQMKGEYRVKDKELQTLFLRALKLTSAFSRISFVRIPREKNKEADALANKAIDEHGPHRLEAQDTWFSAK